MFINHPYKCRRFSWPDEITHNIIDIAPYGRSWYREGRDTDMATYAMTISFKLFY